MNTTIKTGIAAILLLAISCKKENNAIQSPLINKSSISELKTNITGKYTSVKIGTQKWMTKNLDVSRYRNGDNIPYVKSHSEWATLKTGAWCWYNNDSANGAVYGRLYNWYAVNDPRGLAPTGWHVPSKDEWHRLSKFLGNKIAGGKLKDTGSIEASTGLWHAPNAGATNETGFTGLPGGSRGSGIFGSIGYTGYWWSSTQHDTDSTAFWYSFLDFSHEKLPKTSSMKRVAFLFAVLKIKIENLSAFMASPFCYIVAPVVRHQTKAGKLYVFLKRPFFQKFFQQFYMTI